MMSSRGIIGCSAAVLLVALSSAVEIYDDLAPANLETDLAYQEGNDLDTRHVDEMNLPSFQSVLLLRMIKALQAHHGQSRIPYGPYWRKTDELPARNFKDIVFKRLSNVMSNDAPRVTRPQPKWKTKKDVTIPQDVPHAPNIYIPEDGWLNFTGLASKYICGRDCESHDVTTEDGYILKLFHVPGDKKRPVLMMHGILDSADTYVLRGNHSLPAALAAQGYDVWIGNSRGSRYGRRHVKLNPDTDNAFWQFSFHELGIYDLPAMIDFILKKTGESQLSAIGHSQGNQIFYVLGASRPEYNDKINVLVALAPICFLHNVVPPVNKIVELGPLINKFLIMFGMEEVLGDLSLSRTLIDLMCLQEIGYKMCAEGIFFSIAGRDRAEFEPEFFPIVIAHYPTGTSRTNALHLLQVAQKKEFVNYDHGVTKNLVVYNSKVPPNYDLSKVTMKVALIAGRNDKISALKDVKILRKRLPNVVEYRLMDHPQFNHMDFLWGRHSSITLYPHVIKVLNTYN